MMASTAADAKAEHLTNDAQTNSVKEVTVEGTPENSTPKRAKLDEGETSASKKTRSSNKSKRSDAVMMEEAKAAFGELDTSEGRRLRKRSDPSKVEEKRQIPRRNSKRKSVTKEVEPEDEDSAEDVPAEKKNGPGGKDKEHGVSKPDRGAESNELKPEEDASGTKDGTDAEHTTEEAKKEDNAEEQKLEDSGKSEDKEEKKEMSE